MQPRRSVLLIALAAGSVLPGGFATAAATGMSAPLACEGSWTIQSSPNVGSSWANELFGVSGSSASDAWAVGFYFSENNHTLIEHWDGADWGIVSSPDRRFGNQLLAVSALSVDDAWAVGWSDDGSTHTFTLIEHWDGKVWTVVPSPNLGVKANQLNGVTAISPTDVWAVGYWVRDIYSPAFTLILHWDGVRWRVVPHPTITAPNTYLYAATARAPNDVWAVGFDADLQRTLVERWDGLAWGVVPSPSPGQGSSAVLIGVSEEALGSVVAVGEATISKENTLAERWNGQRWAHAPSDSPGVGTNVLNAVSLTSATDGWAVGSYTGTFSLYQPLIEHWDGSRLQRVTVPRQGTLSNELFGVVSISSGDAWAVGRYIDPSIQQYRTLVEHHC